VIRNAVQASVGVRARSTIAGTRKTGTTEQIQEEAKVTDVASQIIRTAGTICWTSNISRVSADRFVTVEHEVIQARSASGQIRADVAVWETAGAV